VLPLRVAALVPDDQRAGTLALALALGGIAATVSNPLFGALSDRTRTRWGRRAPWMLGGVVAGLAGVVLLCTAQSLPGILMAWVFTQVAYNAALAAVSALFADSLSENDRAAASGLFAASTFLGTLPALLLVALFPTAAGAIAAGISTAAVAVVFACARGVRDRARGGDEQRRQREDPRPRAGGPASRGFAIVWVQRLLMQLAFGLATSFTLYLILDRMGASESGAASASALTTLIGGGVLVAASAAAGLWAGRRGNYSPFLFVSAAGLFAAAVARAFADSVPALWVSSALGGFAMGVFFAVDLALALRTMPEARAGQYLGLLNITETLPQIVAPLIAAWLLTLGGPDPVSGAGGNYATLYLVAALAAVLASTLLPLLRTVARRPENAALVTGDR
jgi:MFS family permease